MLEKWNGDIQYIIKGYNYDNNDFLLVSVSVENDVITDENINDLKQIRERSFVFSNEDLEVYIGHIYVEINGENEILRSKTMLNELIEGKRLMNVLDNNLLKGCYSNHKKK